MNKQSTSKHGAKLHLIRHEPPPAVERPHALTLAEAEAVEKRELVRIDLRPSDRHGRLIGHYLAVHPQGNWHQSYVPEIDGDGFLYLRWMRDEAGWFESPVSREEAASLIDEAKL